MSLPGLVEVSCFVCFQFIFVFFIFVNASNFFPWNNLNLKNYVLKASSGEVEGRLWRVTWNSQKGLYENSCSLLPPHWKLVDTTGSDQISDGETGILFSRMATMESHNSLRNLVKDLERWLCIRVLAAFVCKGQRTSSILSTHSGQLVYNQL